MTGETPLRSDRSDGHDRPADPELSRVVGEIRERAAAVRDEQVERALAETESDLNEREREAIRALADRIAARLVAAPVDRLVELDRADDEAVETALDLFGADDEERRDGGE